MRVSSTILYVGALACAYAFCLQFSYFIDYFRDPLSAYRQELLGGILMIGLLSGAVWIPTLAFASARFLRERPRPYFLIFPIVLGGLVGVLSATAVVLSVAA